jgi:transposase
MMPHALTSWEAVDQQTQRWLTAGIFEAIVYDVRMLLRLADERQAQPSAAVHDSRILQSSPENGRRAGYDGAKRQRESKVHIVVDSLGHLLALHVTLAKTQDRAQVAQWAENVQKVTGDAMAMAFVDQGSTGEPPAPATTAHDMQREVVQLLNASRPILQHINTLGGSSRGL